MPPVNEPIDDAPLKPLGKRFTSPCPKCGSRWPIVQAMREGKGPTSKIINCCTHCGIMGTRAKRCTSTGPGGSQCVQILGHAGECSDAPHDSPVAEFERRKAR